MLSRTVIPRGGTVTTRASACPACGMIISRIDNLPLISYLNLGARCRNCLSPIPIRYFLTELIGATIFGSLFVYELVTGATNVPGFKRYFYDGIVWIILYTKWPVVGIYLYHTALFSCLLMLSLMDIDRLRCPKWLAGIILCTFAGLSIGFPTLQPVKFYAHLPSDLAEALPPSMIPIGTCVAGGLIGLFLTSTIHYLCSQRDIHCRICQCLSTSRHPSRYCFRVAGYCDNLAIHCRRPCCHVRHRTDAEKTATRS